MYSFGRLYSGLYAVVQIFTERIKKELEGVPNVEIFVRDEGLYSLLNLSTCWCNNSLGSGKEHGVLCLMHLCTFYLDLRCRTPSFRSRMEHLNLPRSLKCRFEYLPGKSRLIIGRHYKGAADKSAPPVAFVGKGITFDSGGISLKPGAVGWSFSKL